MAKEIERKYLVVNDSYRRLATSAIDLAQGYLSTDVDSTVRVRVAGEKAWITIKGRNCGASRKEWEYSIPTEDARAMLAECCKGHLIEKTRYIVDAGKGLRWEVDVFHGRHEGLVVAEIELPTEDTPYTLPSFIGEEVTGNPAYYNSVLSGV